MVNPVTPEQIAELQRLRKLKAERDRGRAISERVATNMAGAPAFVQQQNRNEGVFGMLTNDPELREKREQSLQNFLKTIALPITLGKRAVAKPGFAEGDEEQITSKDLLMGPVHMAQNTARRILSVAGGQDLVERATGKPANLGTVMQETSEDPFGVAFETAATAGIAALPFLPKRVGGAGPAKPRIAPEVVAQETTVGKVIAKAGKKPLIRLTQEQALESQVEVGTGLPVKVPAKQMQKAMQADMMEAGMPAEAAAEAAVHAAKSPVLDERLIGLSQAEGVKIIESMGREHKTAHETIGRVEALNQAKRDGLDGVTAVKNADEVMMPESRAMGRLLTRREEAGVFLELITQKKIHNAQMAEIESLVLQKRLLEAKAARHSAEQTGDKVVRLREALDYTSSEAGRILNYQKLFVEMETMDIASVKLRARANRGDKLTKAQDRGFEAGVKKYEKASREFDDGLLSFDEAVAKEAKRRAETLFRISQVKARRINKRIDRRQSLRVEREDIKRQIVALGEDGRVWDITGVTAEYSYLIGKLAMNYLQDGALTLADVVGKIVKDYPELTERDVWNSFRAKKPGPTREISEAQARAKDISAEGKLRSKLADAEEGIFEEPKTRRAESPEMRGLRKRLQKLRAVREIERRRIKQMEVDALHPRFAPLLVEGINTMRTLKATADISATARQALLLIPGHPIAFGKKAFPRSIQAMLDEVSAEVIDARMRRSPYYHSSQVSDLYLPDIRSISLVGREEMYMSAWAERIPGWGKIVRASERHMVALLNEMRSAAYEKIAKAHPEASPAELAAWADYINVASGRGNLAKMGRVADVLSGVFFAPRFASSRIEYPFLAAKQLIKGNRRVAWWITKEYVKNAMAGLTALKLAEMAGAEVGLDPRSGDFGKLVIGNTRVDIWAGMAQPARLITRSYLAFHDRAKGSRPPKTRPIDPIGEFGRFTGYKLAPWITVLNELATGQTIVGEERTFIPDLTMPRFSSLKEFRASMGENLEGAMKNTFFRAPLPISAEDIWDAWEDEENLAKTAGFGTLSIFGVGINTHEPKLKPTPTKRLGGR